MTTGDGAGRFAAQRPMPLHEREVAAITSRMQAAHPDIPAATIASLLREVYAGSAGARVQSYRLVLAERSVRRLLRSASARSFTDVPQRAAS